MKVIQILPELNSGGVERGTLEVSKYLVDQGHESIVISNGGRLVSQFEKEGGRHLTLPVHKKALSSLKQVRKLVQVFKEEEPDILHLRSRLPAWLAYLAWKRLPKEQRPKLITTVHGFYSVNGYSKVMTKGEEVICVSHSVKEYVLKNYGKRNPDSLTVIHRGVDTGSYTAEFTPSPDWMATWEAKFPQLRGKLVITLPGRVTRWKGALDFIQVIEKLRAKGVDAHGLLVGESHPHKTQYFEELKQSMALAKLTDHITLVGHRRDLKEVMAVSDVVVSCSKDPEAFGRVTLEALSLKKKVVAYSHGGVKEQLEALFPEGCVAVGDIDGMVEAIKVTLEKPESRPLSNQQFTLSAMLSKTLAVYQK